MWSFLFTGFIVLAHIGGFVSAAHALFTVRTSQGTVAWVIALLGFPVVSLPLYWIFGARRLDIYQQTIEDARARYLSEATTLFGRVEAWTASSEDPRFNEALRDMATVADSTWLSGNKVALLVDGRQTFDVICAAMETAKTTIALQFYIVRNDALGERVASILKERASAGVRVYFLYDGWGCKDLPDVWVGDLKKAGVEMIAFSGKGPRAPGHINFRNHRKIVSVDGERAFVGGHNIGIEYLGQAPKYGAWRDTHVEVTGPAVLPIQLSFAADWYFAAGALPLLSWEGVSQQPSDYPVLTLSTGPGDEVERCTLFFMHLITMAKRRLWIASPYFVPDETMLHALQLAALRGVEVRILLPVRPDHHLVWLASFSYLKELDLPNVSIHRYRDGFLHQKVVLVDDELAVIGTANFDNRSFRLNFEMSIATADPRFASEVRAMLERDFSNSQRVSSREYEEKTWLFRLSAKAARLLSPIL